MAIQDSSAPIPVPGEHRPPPSAPVRERPPPVGALIIGLCGLGFLLHNQLVTQEPGLGAVPIGLLYGPLVAEGQWWRALTTVFAHGGPLHLILNMSVVYSLGFPFERGLGSARFALISLICALGASATVVLLAFEKPTVGASGMILGYAGAMLPAASQQVRKNLLIWLVQIAVISLLPGVSWQGHLGGLVWGLLCGLALKAGPKVFRVAGPALVVVAVGMLLLAAQHPLLR